MATENDRGRPDELSELVAAAQAGDREAFNELVRRTYVEMYTLAVRLTANEEDASDVVQEAYLRAWKGIRRFRGDAQFTAQVYILTKEEGGRHTPFFTNYHPQFYFRTTDVTGTVSLPEGTEMVMPGDNTEMTVELINPIAMEEGLRFAIREGGRTVGAGRVIKILK